MDREFLARDPRAVAPDLLGCDLIHQTGQGLRRGRIVEVEAYCGADDPAAHTYRGPTPRNRTMFGPPGHLYVYRSYGIHWCANVVCGTGTPASPGEGVAVLLRALHPIDGLDAMYVDRGRAARRDRDLASGPGKLCAAMAIDGSHDGVDVCAGGPVRIGPAERPAAIVQTTRIGLTKAVDEPWRWYVDGDPNVSRLASTP